MLQIHLSLPPGDILVFMTGQEDIEITCQVVNGKLSNVMLDVSLTFAHSRTAFSVGRTSTVSCASNLFPDAGRSAGEDL